jgi:hypothetical protein
MLKKKNSNCSGNCAILHLGNGVYHDTKTSFLNEIFNEIKFSNKMIVHYRENDLGLFQDNLQVTGAVIEFMFKFEKEQSPEFILGV